MNRSFSFGVVFAITVATSSAGSAQENTFRSVEALKKLGVERCLGTVNRMTKFFFDSDDFAFLNQWSSTQPNDHMTVTYMSKPFDDGAVQINLAVAPTVEGNCDVHFTHTLYVKGSCGKVRESTFKDWKYYADLTGTPLYEDPTATTVNVGLTSISSGCLVVKSGFLQFKQDSRK